MHSYWFFRLLLVCSLLATHSNAADWDMAIAFNSYIEFFYSNQTSMAITNQRFTYVSSITYDPVHDIVYFSDTTENTYTIYGLTFNENHETNIVKKSVESGGIFDMVIDPVTETLYWTDSSTSEVKSLSLTSDLKSQVIYQNEYKTPMGIAIDNCNRVLYWINYKYQNSSIERMQLNNKSRIEVILEQDLHNPTDLKIESRHLYWIDNRHGVYYKIERANLDGSDREEMFEGENHIPSKLFVSNESVFWTERQENWIWQLPLNITKYSEPVQIKILKNQITGLVKRIDVLEQTKNISECKYLRYLTQLNNKKNLDNNSVQLDKRTYCLNKGIFMYEMKKCRCLPGFTGDRCEVNTCHNYCVHGDCTLAANGSAICSCLPTYQGERCDERIMCRNGVSKITKTKVFCKCLEGWKGELCEIPMEVTTTTMQPIIYDNKENEVTNKKNVSTIIDNNTVYKEINYTLIREEDRKNVCFIWSNEYIITICCVFCFLVVIIFILFYKVLKPRQPRIIRRIIGKKAIKGDSRRPIRNGCEITIEDCCNMNKCETPCHESDNIYSQLIDI